jgi:hypothetical protein
VRRNLLDRIDRSGDCWLWLGAKNAKGYGIVSRRTYGTSLAHRAVWERTFGRIADGLCVLHRCDVPACVKLAHLFLGTVADNNADMREKGRGARGERHGITRLTADQVAAIRAAAGSHQSIATQFGVHQSTVTRIRNGVVWAVA